MRTFLMKLSSILLAIISYLLITALVFFVLSYAVPHIKDLDSYPYIKSTFNLEQSFIQSVRSILSKFIPTRIENVDITRPLMIVVFLVLLSNVNRLREHLFVTRAYQKYEVGFKDFLQNSHLDERNKGVMELKHGLEELKHVDLKKRRALILHFMEIQHKLESYKSELAFLSIDVVDSTTMKAKEDPTAVSADFYRYHEMVEKILHQNAAIKIAKTPDGIMSAFPHPSAAVTAGQQLINELAYFNKTAKTVKMDFEVRCGINMGTLYFDPEEPLEHHSDRVIDIAGHMQKLADPNTINISKSAIAPLPEKNAFVNAQKMIDEQVVYTWKPPSR